jgi:uncharacterized protein (DUF58 family)
MASKFNPVSAVRSRFQAWLHARQPRTDTLLLTQRNVYILPTRAGLMFAFTLMVLLVASINYQLNLGYVLTFLLAGSGVVSMHMTHATLRGLILNLKPTTTVFVGDPAALDMILTSPGKARYSIGLKVLSTPAIAPVWVDVPNLAQAAVRLSFVPSLRGLHEAPTITVETRFPLGLFRAWAVWRPAAQWLIYPQPEQPAVALPTVLSTSEGTGSARSAVRHDSGAEVEGVRAYRRGDPPKLIAWKKAAKALNAGGELVSRDTSKPAHQQLWLDWHACSPLAPEARLSRLTAWSVAADRAGVNYGLRLPGLELSPLDGEIHRRRCLEALALWR